MDYDEARALGEMIEADDPQMEVWDPDVVDTDDEGDVYAIAATDKRTGTVTVFYSHQDWANYPSAPLGQGS